MAKLERVKKPNLGRPEIVSSKSQRVAMHRLCQVPLAQKVEDPERSLRRVGRPFCPRCHRLVGKKEVDALAMSDFLTLPELEVQFPGERFLSLQRMPPSNKDYFTKPKSLPAGVINPRAEPLVKPNGYSENCSCPNCMDYRSAKRKREKLAGEYPPVKILNALGQPAYEFKRQGVLVSLPSTHYSEAAAQEILAALQTAPADLSTEWVAGTQSENGSFGISKEKMKVYYPEEGIDQIVDEHRREENPCREAYVPWLPVVLLEQPNLEERFRAPEQASLPVDFQTTPDENILKRKGVSVHLRRDYYSPAAVSTILKALEDARPEARTESLAEKASQQYGVAAAALLFTYDPEKVRTSLRVPPIPVEILNADADARAFRRGGVTVYLPKEHYDFGAACRIYDVLREAEGHQDTAWVARRASESEEVRVPSKHLRVEYSAWEPSPSS